MRLAVHRRFYGRKKFGSYKKDDPKRASGLKVERSRTLELLRKAWNECDYEEYVRYGIDTMENEAIPLDQIPNFDSGNPLVEGGASNSFFMNLVKSKLQGLSITPKEVEIFSLILPELEELEKTDHFSEKAGLFLSQLINQSKGGAFIVHTEQLERSISMMGFSTNKHITVKGSLGESAGEHMGEKGVLVVEGDVGDGAGDHCRGKILIKGDAGNELGVFLQETGVIEISGEFESVGFFADEASIFGTIIHKGEIIWTGGSEV